MHPHPELYRQAYARYLRRGTPLDVSLKAAAHPTPYYIWRTRGDDKIRTSHAENNGRIFAWDNPPPTGNPGEDYGYRCMAEPYIEGKSEYAYQTLWSALNDNPKRWLTVDFLYHFYHGNGVAVILSETGNLVGVINYYLYTLGTYNRLNAQIISEARKHSSGGFTYNFHNSYTQFYDYLYAFGGVTIGGTFTGTVLHKNGRMYIEGYIDYYYRDTFTDPLDRRENRIGTSDPSKIDLEILKDTEYGGKYYDIFDKWKTRFSAEAIYQKKDSRYAWE